MAEPRHNTLMREWPAPECAGTSAAEAKPFCIASAMTRWLSGSRTGTALAAIGSEWWAA